MLSWTFSPETEKARKSVLREMPSHTFLFGNWKKFRLDRLYFIELWIATGVWTATTNRKSSLLLRYDSPLTAVWQFTIAVHGPIKDRYRAVDRYCGWDRCRIPHTISVPLIHYFFVTDKIYASFFSIFLCFVFSVEQARLRFLTCCPAVRPTLFESVARSLSMDTRCFYRISHMSPLSNKKISFFQTSLFRNISQCR